MREHEPGERLEGTIFGSSCAGLNGLKKYFTWNGTLWIADPDTDPEDDGYDGCLFLNTGNQPPATIICNNQQCPPHEGCSCFNYLLNMNAYECAQDQSCPSECSCGEPFYLRFDDVEGTGGPYMTSYGIQYLCKCDDVYGCIYPFTFDIEFYWEE